MGGVFLVSFFSKDHSSSCLCKGFIPPASLLFFLQKLFLGRLFAALFATNSDSLAALSGKGHHGSRENLPRTQVMAVLSLKEYRRSMVVQWPCALAERDQNLVFVCVFVGVVCFIWPF